MIIIIFIILDWINILPCHPPAVLQNCTWTYLKFSVLTPVNEFTLRIHHFQHFFPYLHWGFVLVYHSVLFKMLKIPVFPLFMRNFFHPTISDFEVFFKAPRFDLSVHSISDRYHRFLLIFPLFVTLIPDSSFISLFKRHSVLI